MKFFRYILVIMLLFPFLLLSEPQKLKFELVIADSDIDENFVFPNPVDFTVADNGDIYILDRENPVIRQFNKNNEYVNAFGHMGVGPGEMTNPLKIDVINDTIHVLCATKSLRFNSQGKLISETIFSKPRGMRRGTILNNGKYVGFNYDLKTKTAILGIYSSQFELEKIVEKVPLNVVTIKQNGNSYTQAQAETYYLFSADSKNNIYYSSSKIFELCKYSNGGKKLLSKKTYKPRLIEKNTAFKQDPEMKKLFGNKLDSFKKAKFEAIVNFILVDSLNNIWALIKTENKMLLEKFSSDGKHLKTLFWDEKIMNIWHNAKIINNNLYYWTYDEYDGLKIYRANLK